MTTPTTPNDAGGETPGIGRGSNLACPASPSPAEMAAAVEDARRYAMSDTVVLTHQIDVYGVCRALIASQAEVAEARDDADRRARFMETRGYRRCDIAACNCNSWHGGHAKARLDEIADALSEANRYVRGKTLLQEVNLLIADLAASKAEAEALQRERDTAFIAEQRATEWATKAQAEAERVAREVRMKDLDGVLAWIRYAQNEMDEWADSLKKAEKKLAASQAEVERLRFKCETDGAEYYEQARREGWAAGIEQAAKMCERMGYAEAWDDPNNHGTQCAERIRLLTYDATPTGESKAE